ncbi:MAG: acetyl-CoA carboxylase biotin carboxyl carrier protein subunit, partial [Chloroflexi bacterium]|nr:acetyl-CoA carboxylase biotin carboxyl carrier protein subunit [Chloroflexota bacterium]
MKKGRIVALIAVLALLGSMIAAGCAAPAPAPTPTPAPTPAPAPAPAPA